MAQLEKPEVSKLFECGLHARKCCIQAGAEARHHSDYGNRDAGRNESIFNSGGSRLISKNSARYLATYLAMRKSHVSRAE